MNPTPQTKSGNPFVRAVQRGLVKGPQQRGFTIEEWENGYKKYGITESDKLLHESGRWFHDHFRQIRAYTDRFSETASLTRPLSILAFIAAANREWIVVKTRAAEMFSAKDGIMFEELEQERLPASSGNPLYITNAIDTTVDGARFPLARAAQAIDSTQTNLTEEQWHAHVMMFIFGGYYHVLEQYWMHCVWNGYAAISQANEVSIRPIDAEFHKKLTVSLYRRTNRYNQCASVGATLYNKLSKSGVLPEHTANKPILSTFKKRGIFRVKADLASRFPRRRSAGPSLRKFVYEEHLSALTIKRFNCLSGLSIDIISEAFELIGGLPEQIFNFVPRETSLKSWSHAELFAPKLRRDELATALRSALNISAAQVEFILSYATWKSDPRQELWFAPLIPIDNEHISIICLAVEGVNTIRLCEQLIADFPELKPEADNAFEAFLRAELAKSFKASPLAAICSILPDAHKPKDPLIGDIDILFRLGGTIWVGEAKSGANIFSPIEDFRYANMLSEQAVPQALRKCDYVVKNLAEVAPLLAIKPSEVQSVQSVVITSNPAFAGFPIEGVPIVDWHILHLFFSEGALQNYAYIADDGRTACVDRERFYESPQDAAQRLPQYLADPPQIRMPRMHVHEDVSDLLPSNVLGEQSVRAYNFTVKIPTEGVMDLVQRVAIARGDWTERGRIEGLDEEDMP